MNLLNFIHQYPDEQAFIARFKAQRDPNGVVCPQCGFRDHFWLKNKLSYECPNLRCALASPFSAALRFKFTHIPMQQNYERSAYKNFV